MSRGWITGATLFPVAVSAVVVPTLDGGDLWPRARGVLRAQNLPADMTALDRVGRAQHVGGALGSIGPAVVDDGRIVGGVRGVTPPTTPAGSQLFIAGNDARIGNRRPDSVVMMRESDSVWSFSLAFQKDAVLQFKITRGSWDAEAIYQEGEVPADSRLTVDRDTTITLRPITWRDRNFTSSIAGGITGSVRYHRALEGRGLRYKRDLIIWLPPSYETDSVRRYPVLYMHDGQNVFDPATSFRQFDWRADEVLSRCY